MDADEHGQLAKMFGFKSAASLKGVIVKLSLDK